jgi:5-methylcytosine-specific restriction endonuclease McrA
MNSTIKPSKCRECGSPYHSAMYHKPRKPIETKLLPARTAIRVHCTHCDSLEHFKSNCPKVKPKWKDRVPGPDGRYPPMKSYIVGFKEKWGRCRTKWVKENPPNHAGFYQCHYCGLNIPKDEMQLDHKIPRSRAPELRFELSNLTPSCGACNLTKGSVDHDNYKHDCPDNIKETI